MLKKTTIHCRIRASIFAAGIIFLILFIILVNHKNKLEKQIINDHQLQFTHEVELLLNLHTKSFTNTLIDNAYWDDLIIAIDNKDTSWFTTNFTLETTSSYDYYCAYNSKYEIIRHESNDKLHSEINISRVFLEKLKRSRTEHFFLSTPEGLMDVCAGSIHSSDDIDLHETQPSGYLILLKKWDPEFITDFGSILGSKVEVKTGSDSSYINKSSHIQAKIMLKNWDGEPIASLVSERNLNLNFKATQDILFVIMAIVILMLILFYYISHKLIYKPLKVVTEILETDNQEFIDQLKKAPAEYGRIGYLFETYVSQKQELVKAKEKAEESDILKSAFLANMSHEIRTPMNGILGFAELLKEPNLSGEQQQGYIRIIEKSGTRMLNIINDVVDISKIEAGLMAVEKMESNVNEQIEYVYTLFKPEVEAKGMTLLFRNGLISEDSIIVTDRGKVFAIIMNLVKNAIKYTDEGSIEFGYTKKGDKLEFYVKDYGIGIEKDRQEAIFERFIQADNLDKMARQGAGLGLAIAKAYVEMLGGKIWLESEFGKGTTFFFTLPYQNKMKGKNRLGSENSIPEEKNEIDNLKILIVDDDEISDKLLSIIINNFGKEIIHVKNGNEAVKACHNTHDIDLILMDIRMSGLDGYEATRQIRRFNKDVIIIAQTAYGLSGDREKAIEAGCNDHIAKPVSKDKMLALIQKYFQKQMQVNNR